MVLLLSFMRRLHTLLCFLLFLSPLCRAQDCQQLFQALWPQGVVHAQFEVTKEVPGVPVPLVSRGNVTLAPNRGLIWETLEPFVGVQIFGVKKSARSDETGRLTVSDNAPSSHLMEELSGDKTLSQKRLLERFHLSCSVRGDKTSAILSPRDNLLQTYLSEASIRVGRVIEEAVLYTPDGKRTRIAFSKQHVDSTPTVRELKYFEAVQ